MDPVKGRMVQGNFFAHFLTVLIDLIVPDGVIVACIDEPMGEPRQEPRQVLQGSLEFGIQGPSSPIVVGRVAKEPHGLCLKQDVVAK